MVAVDFFDSVLDDYGAEEEGITRSDREGVEIPNSRAHVTAEQLMTLEENVNPLSSRENVGIDLFLQALRIINFVCSPICACARLVEHVALQQWRTVRCCCCLSFRIHEDKL